MLRAGPGTFAPSALLMGSPVFPRRAIVSACWWDPLSHARRRLQVLGDKCLARPLSPARPSRARSVLPALDFWGNSEDAVFEPGRARTLIGGHDRVRFPRSCVSLPLRARGALFWLRNVQPGPRANVFGRHDQDRERPGDLGPCGSSPRGLTVYFACLGRRREKSVRRCAE